MQQGQVIIREAVGIFDSMPALQSAVDNLEVKSFPRETISVMANPEKIEQVFGVPAVSPRSVESDSRTPRQPLVRTEEKAVGAGALISVLAYISAVSAALLAATVSVTAILPAAVFAGLAGGLIGVYLVELIREHLERTTSDQLLKGGLLLWVRTPDTQHEQSACKIMKDHGARYVRIHDIAY